MKKAFRSVLAFMLVFVIMASVFCTAGVFAASDTVYTAHLHGTGNATLATEEISVGTETTYTVSFLWKSVQGNARVRLSGSAVGSKNVDLIVDGSYPMPGINYNWQTGRVTYTFTANGDALFSPPCNTLPRKPNFTSAMLKSSSPMQTAQPLRTAR